MTSHKRISFCLLFLCIRFSKVFCFNLIEEDVIKFSLGNNDTYFGYTVLLQKGPPQPLVIVGAPKAGLKGGGGLFSCTLNGTCERYEINIDNEYDSVSNFLGSSLDGSDSAGEEVIVCAPRMVTMYPLQKGICFYHSNSTITKEKPEEIISLAFEEDYMHDKKGYLYGMAQAGFSIHLMKKQEKVLLGAPGALLSSGCFIEQSVKKLTKGTISSDYEVIPKIKQLTSEKTNEYLGYSVTSGHLLRNGKKSYQVAAGAPRAALMRGQVQIFDGNNSPTVHTSEETGSYLGGAVLALDVDNDKIDELFVGAPFVKGSTYDEGYVIVFKKEFSAQDVLYGSRKTGGRFGTAIVSLGDLDWDNFKDVAISAPYEDDGVGAVYIYMGSKDGIKEPYSQRLSPLSFNGGSRGTRGFGLGLSRGNDVDGNGHNDLAVGAYRSGEVFVFKSRTIIDYRLKLITNVTTFKSNNAIGIKYCVSYIQRSPAKNQRNVEFNITLNLDYRTNGTISVEKNCTADLHKDCCHNLEVIVKDMVNQDDLGPYKISMRAKCLSSVIAYGESSLEKAIPYAHGCGTDNICQTNITLTSRTNSIIVDQDKEVNVTITANNSGETGLRCMLTITVPEMIELIQSSNCPFEKNSYTCLFTSNLTTTKENTYTFDVSRISPSTILIEINFGIKCLGDSVNQNTSAKINVSLRNSPFIEGIPDSQKKYFQRTQPQDFNVTHFFNVGNDGPSPVKLDLFILLPIVQYQHKDIFQFSQVTRNGLLQDCRVSDRKSDLNKTKFVKIPANGTVVYDCFQKGAQYKKILCEGGYFPKTSKVRRYEVTFTVKTALISQMYEEEILKKEDVIAYVTSAFIKNDTNTIINAHTVTSIQSSGDDPIFLMAYIVTGVLLGIVLLGLLIWLCYRCHFFDRTLRDRMKDKHLTTNEIYGLQQTTEIRDQHRQVIESLMITQKLQEADGIQETDDIQKTVDIQKTGDMQSTDVDVHATADVTATSYSADNAAHSCQTDL